MAGYCGFSKSNNAINAENQGLMTAGKLAQALKISTAAVKKFCTPCEWHHTSSWYNRTNYYYEPELLTAASVPVEEEFDADVEERAAAILLLEKMQEFSRKDVVAKKTTYNNCIIKWLEWSGSRRHPVAYERTVENCRVETNGKTCTIMLPTGRKFTKREKTNGFSYHAVLV